MSSELALLKKIPVPITLDQFKTGDIVINYAKTGSGPDAVLIHGANLGWGQWYVTIANLAQTHTVWAVDLPGSGKSSPLDFYSLNFNKHLIEPVKSFLNEKKIRHGLVIGHSLGAWVALKLMTLDHSLFDKAVLVSPVGFSKNTPLRYKLIGLRWLANLLAKTAVKPTRKNIENFLKTPLRQKNVLISEFIDYYFESISKNKHGHPFNLLNRMSGFRKVSPELVFGEEISHIKQPIMIIGGEFDPVVPLNSKQLKAISRLPNVKIKILKDTGHVPPLEKSMEFHKILSNFIKTK